MAERQSPVRVPCGCRSLSRGAELHCRPHGLRAPPDRKRLLLHSAAGTLGCSRAAAIGYQSLLGDTNETIKVEVSFREPILLPAARFPARTLLLDPISGDPLVTSIEAPCISLSEAMAEKLRAALTRREVAIRDFFDLHHAVTALSLDPDAPDLVELVRRKLAIPGNDPIAMGEDRLAQLRAQLAARLRPVLRQKDFDRFELDLAFAVVQKMAAAVATKPCTARGLADAPGHRPAFPASMRSNLGADRQSLALAHHGVARVLG